jgi:archaellum component FlaC
LDQELIAYLDERFRETSRQIESLREETTQQIGGLREETIQQIGGLRQETTQRFERLEERMDERFRHTGIEIEALSDKIRQVGDGVAGARESLGAFRQEVAVEFKDVRSSIRVPFENLNKRVLILEAKVKALSKNPQKGKSRPPS